jgi:hypothetical protein
VKPADAVDLDRLVGVFLELVAIDNPTGQEEAIPASSREVILIGCRGGLRRWILEQFNRKAPR